MNKFDLKHETSFYYIFITTTCSAMGGCYDQNASALLNTLLLLAVKRHV